MLSINDTTPLADLGLSHVQTVLEEAFGVVPPGLFPEAPQPRTVGELAALVRKPVAEVARQLEAILALEAKPEISAEDLKAMLDRGEAPLLVDVREEWEFDLCRLPGSILLANVSFPDFLPQMVAAKEVVTICHHGMRSYSAALFLRQRGVRQARSLAGGVDYWARVIDKAMARY